MDYNSLKRKILYVSTHRGTKESDILVSRFTDYILPKTSNEDLPDLLEFLQISDLVLLDWYFQRKTPNPDEITPFVTMYMSWIHDPK